MFSSQASTNVDDGSEDWFLQLSELADGRFICSVYRYLSLSFLVDVACALLEFGLPWRNVSTEPRASGSKLTFSNFELRLGVQNLPLPANVPTEATQQYIARYGVCVVTHHLFDLIC